MNKVVLLGRLVADPEVRYTANQVVVVNFRLAVRRRFKNQNNEYESDFFNVAAWNKTAEFISMYFKKGQQIALCGRLQSRSYDTQDGTKRYVTEVIAEEVDFAGGKKEEVRTVPTSTTNTVSEENEGIDFDSLNRDEFKIDVEEEDISFIE